MSERRNRKSRRMAKVISPPSIPTCSKYPQGYQSRPSHVPLSGGQPQYQIERSREEMRIRENETIATHPKLLDGIKARPEMPSCRVYLGHPASAWKPDRTDETKWFNLASPISSLWRRHAVSPKMLLLPVSRPDVQETSSWPLQQRASNNDDAKAFRHSKMVGVS